MPTASERALVSLATAIGYTHDQTRRLVRPEDGGIGKSTLEKYFRPELETAGERLNAAVANSLFAKATGNGRESVRAAIFWLKARAGWREGDGLSASASLRRGGAPGDGGQAPPEGEELVFKIQLGDGGGEDG